MLVGQETAIIPIGLSCQPAEQLRRLGGTFSRILSENFKYQSSILNWIICTPEGVAEFFERYSSREICAEDIFCERRPELIRNKIWLLHEHPADNQGYLSEDAERVAKKFEYLRQKLFALRKIRTRTFVICQADNNLTFHYMWEDGRMDYGFDRRRLNRIKASIDEAFPSGRNRLVVIALKGRTSKIDWSYPTAVFEPDNSEWGGDDAQWNEVAHLIALGRNKFPLLPESWPRPALTIRNLQSVHSFTAADERLKTAVGQRIDGLIRLEGAGGGGLYGPYVRLPAGFYEMGIRFAASEIRGAARMDVACGLDVSVRAARPVLASNLIDREAKLRVAFERDMINVEVRLWCDDGFVGAIESVAIKRLSS